MSDSSPSKSSSNEGWVYLILFGLVMLAALLVPVLLSVGLYFLLRAYLRKTEAWILALVGAVAVFINPKVNLQNYFEWLVVLVTGNGNRLDIPWLPILGMTALFTGLTVILRGTRAAAWLPTTIGKVRGSKKTSEDAILPTMQEKQRIDLAKPSSQTPLLAPASNHSVVAPTPQGKRSFPIGRDKNGAPVMLNESEIKTHGLIFGSTGSGKSETIKAIAGGLLDLGWDGMILDLKEDTAHEGLRDWCDTYASSHSLPYQELCLSSDNPKYWFNPLAGMGLDEARDTILSMQNFETPYYEALNKLQLGELLAILWGANEIDPIAFPLPTFGKLGKILSANSLKDAVKAELAVLVKHRNVKPSDFPAVTAPDKALADSARGLGARIAAESVTSAGRLMLSPPADGVNRPLIDVTRGGVTYVGLDSTGKIELSRVVSTAVLKRMSVYASDRISGKVDSRGGKPKQRFLIIDEANFINRKVIMALLSRARSSGIALILCTQGPLDWRAAPGEPGVEELAQNTNVTVIMSQGERESAEICADIIGRREKTQLIQRMSEGEIISDSGTLQTKVDHMVSPDDLRMLSTGEAIIRVNKPQTRVVWAKIAMRDPKLKVNRQ